jgi:hypothetical protein
LAEACPPLCCWGGLGARFGCLRAGCAHRRCKAEEQARDDSNGHRKREHSGINGGVDKRAIPSSSEERREESDAPLCKHESCDCAESDEHCAFGKQLPQQPAAASPYREAHGHLGLPGGCARQQQRRDVRASDQQHERDDHHHGQSRLSIPGAHRRWTAG